MMPFMGLKEITLVDGFALTNGRVKAHPKVIHPIAVITNAPLTK